MLLGREYYLRNDADMKRHKAFITEIREGKKIIAESFTEWSCSARELFPENSKLMQELKKDVCNTFDDFIDDLYLDDTLIGTKYIIGRFQFGEEISSLRKLASIMEKNKNLRIIDEDGKTISLKQFAKMCLPPKKKKSRR